MSSVAENPPIDKDDGFEFPKANFSPVPHRLVDRFPDFDTKGEVLCVLYVLRHTWGFQEYGKDQWKWITYDEFMRGRKRADGSRMDNGCGLTKPTVIKALRLAVLHGFLQCKEDRRDKARIKRAYRLRLSGEVKNLYGAVLEVDASGKEIIPRTESNTSETNDSSADAEGVPTEAQKQAWRARKMAATFAMYRNNWKTPTKRVIDKWQGRKGTGVIGQLASDPDFADVTPQDFLDFLKDYEANNPDAAKLGALDTISKRLAEFMDLRGVEMTDEQAIDAFTDVQRLYYQHNRNDRPVDILNADPEVLYGILESRGLVE